MENTNLQRLTIGRTAYTAAAGTRAAGRSMSAEWAAVRTLLRVLRLSWRGSGQRATPHTHRNTASARPFQDSRGSLSSTLAIPLPQMTQRVAAATMPSKQPKRSDLRAAMMR